MANVKATNNGSGLWSKAAPSKPHLLPAGHAGVEGEITKVRADAQASLVPLAALTVDEFTAPAGGSTLICSQVPKARAGAAVGVILHEVVDGVALGAPTGTLTSVSGNIVYTPVTAPNGTHSYAIYYEYVGSLGFLQCGRRPRSRRRSGPSFLQPPERLGLSLGDGRRSSCFGQRGHAGLPDDRGRRPYRSRLFHPGCCVEVEDGSVKKLTLFGTRFSLVGEEFSKQRQDTLVVLLRVI